MICELPAGELRCQPSRDSSLHDNAAALVLDLFDFARLMEERDQGALLIWQADADGSVALVQLALNKAQQFRNAGTTQRRDGG